MKQKQVSKKDLQKKIARLKEKMTAVNKRLDKQARAYHKLRKQFESLPGYKSLRRDIAAINQRLDDWPAGAGSQAFNTFLQEQSEQARHIEDLAKEVQTLQKDLSHKMDSVAVHTAQTQELEAYAADLTRARQDQGRKLTQLVEDTAGLPTQYSRLEQMVTELANRIHAFEASSDALAHNEDALSSRLKTQDQQIEDLWKQLATLSEMLQGLLVLQVDRRLDDQDQSNERLAESLAEHQKRLASLAQDQTVLADRLDTASGDIQAQADSCEALRNQVRSLVSECKASAENACRQQEQQQALKEQANELLLQQTRQDTVIEGLQRHVKQYAGLGLVLLLFAAVIPGFLLLNPSLKAKQAGEDTNSVPTASEVQALQKDVAELHRQLAQLDSAVARLDQSVEKIKVNTNPALPGQLATLSHTVESLSREGLEQQQTTAGMLADQKRMDTAIDEVAADVEVLKKKLDQVPVLEVAAQAEKRQQWLKAQKLGLFTLQLMGVYKRESLARFIRQQGIEPDSAIHVTQYHGRRWYELFYGIFDSTAEASAAAQKLPKVFAEQKPWVRQIPEAGDLFPL